MNTFQIVNRRQAWLGLLAALAPALIWTSARAAILVEDAGDEVATSESSAGRWETVAISSARSVISSEGQALIVRLAPGDHASFSRAADLHPTPSAILFRFNVSLPEIEAVRPTTQVFRVGWGFGASNSDEADTRTYARLGLGTAASGGFQLRDLAGGSSPAFHGTQAVTWALNNAGRSLSYAAPDGTIERIADDRMDVWVGRSKVFDDIAATNPAGRITDLKWFWSQGSGVTRFDRFEIRTLEEAADLSTTVSAETASTEEPPAALSSSPASHEASVALGRPTPNPFTRTTRYSYAIPDGSAAVDIGVFDLAGRRIRVLARGVQSQGQYEVRWDGLGDDGSRVKHGVYFIRAAVGGDRRVSRLVYLSK